MFKRMLILFVLFTSISCKQSPSSLLSSTPPQIDDGITDGGNTDGSDTDGGTDSGLEYGYYDVYILGNNEIEKKLVLSISNTYEMFENYSNMILNSDKSSKFKLSKNSSSSASSESTATETYIFDENLNLVKEGAQGTISKKFRGVCLVRIYPDAPTIVKSSLSVGNYTIAGVYTEMEENNTGVSSRAMKNTSDFQSYGYDELIILRYDHIINTTSEAGDTAADASSSYRADILFNNDEGINFYYYDPDRTFANQNTDYIFERVTVTK